MTLSDIDGPCFFYLLSSQCHLPLAVDVLCAHLSLLFSYFLQPHAVSTVVFLCHQLPLLILSDWESRILSNHISLHCAVSVALNFSHTMQSSFFYSLVSRSPSSLLLSPASSAVFSAFPLILLPPSFLLQSPA